jgi:serine/threonine protein kinase
VFAKIKAGSYHFNHVEFQRVSEEGKSLLRKLLQVDPDKRISGEQALKDPWFRKFK